MSELNPAQKGFMQWLATVIGLLLAGLLLAFVADSRIADMETAADMTIYSWIKIIGGWLFAASTLSSILALRYGGRHKTEICEQVGFCRLLTIYRVMFWMAFTSVLLVIAGLIWLGAHLGPVR